MVDIVSWQCCLTEEYVECKSQSVGVCRGGNRRDEGMTLSICMDACSYRYTQRPEFIFRYYPLWILEQNLTGLKLDTGCTGWPVSPTDLPFSTVPSFCTWFLGICLSVLLLWKVAMSIATLHLKKKATKHLTGDYLLSEVSIIIMVMGSMAAHRQT